MEVPGRVGSRPPSRTSCPTELANPDIASSGAQPSRYPSEAQPLDQHSVRDTSTESGSAAPLENSPWRRAYKAVPPLGAHLRPQMPHSARSATTEGGTSNAQRPTSNAKGRFRIWMFCVRRSVFSYLAMNAEPTGLEPTIALSYPD